MPWLAARARLIFLRTLALPDEIEHWSKTTMREKLIKIGAKVVRQGRYVTLQLAEIVFPRPLFVEIPRLIGGPRLVLGVSQLGNPR